MALRERMSLTRYLLTTVKGQGLARKFVRHCKTWIETPKSHKNFHLHDTTMPPSGPPLNQPYLKLTTVNPGCCTIWPIDGALQGGTHISKSIIRNKSKSHRQWKDTRLLCITDGFQDTPTYQDRQQQFQTTGLDFLGVIFSPWIPWAAGTIVRKSA